MCPKTQDEMTHKSMTPYASAIGSIMYVMLCTRPDVSFSLRVMSIYQLDPSEGYRVAVKNILKYLRSTKDVLLINGDDNLIVRCRILTTTESKYIDGSYGSLRRGLDKVIHLELRVVPSIVDLIT